MTRTINQQYKFSTKREGEREREKKKSLKISEKKNNKWIRNSGSFNLLRRKRKLNQRESLARKVQ